MVSTTTSPTQIRPNVPSTRVLHTINPSVSLILRSPFHRLLSSRLLLLTFTGRKSGRTYTIPVGYTWDAETLTLFTDHGWWKNLRGDGGAPVTVHLQGRERSGRAEAIEDPAAAVAAAERLVARYGPKDAGSRIGLALDPKMPPTHDELADALAGHVVIFLALDP